MPRRLFAGGSPALTVTERPPGPTSSTMLELNAPAGRAVLEPHEAEDLRDAIVEWLEERGR